MDDEFAMACTPAEARSNGPHETHETCVKVLPGKCTRSGERSTKYVCGGIRKPLRIELMPFFTVLRVRGANARKG